MLGYILLGLPILCLSLSVLYCGMHLWLTYKNEIHVQAHRTLKKIGLWKTGMGRWVRLRKYSFCYVGASIVSVVISILIQVVQVATEKEIIEKISAFVGRLSIVEMRKLFATLVFAGVTVFASLLMYGRDFSKIDCELSKFRKYLGHFIWNATPLIIWGLFGLVVYKDYFFRDAYEWISSPGRVFQLCWGAVSIIILGTAVRNNFLKKPRGTN